MEIYVILILVVMLTYLVVRKIKKANEGKSCCK
jgi:hypothetical protein